MPGEEIGSRIDLSLRTCSLFFFLFRASSFFFLSPPPLSLLPSLSLPQLLPPSFCDFLLLFFFWSFLILFLSFSLKPSLKPSLTLTLPRPFLFSNILFLFCFSFFVASLSLLFLFLFSFLVADTQLYKRLCPSVRWSVGWSVRHARVEKWENAHFRPCPSVRNWWPCIRPCFYVLDEYKILKSILFHFAFAPLTPKHRFLVSQ